MVPAGPLDRASRRRGRRPGLARGLPPARRWRVTSPAHLPHAVGDGDDDGEDVCEGDAEGDAVCEGDAECDGEGEADFDGFGEGDFVEGEGCACGEYGDWPWNAAEAEGSAAAGDDLAGPDSGAATVPGAPAGLLGEVPTLAWTPLIWAVLGWGARTFAAWEPGKASSVTLTAATTHTATAAAAIAGPG